MSSIINAAAARRTTRIVAWLPCAALALAFVAVFFPALRELVRDWSLDPNYEHGFLIPVIAAYLLWQERAALQRLAVQPAWGIGFALLSVSLALYIVAMAGAEWFIARAAMLLALYSLVLGFAGKIFFRRALVPLLYLAFMIPLPYVIYYRLTFPLQQIASTGAFHLLRALGLAGQQEGNILHFSGFSLEVIEACSGLRSMMVLVALAALIAYLTTLPTRWRWVLFLTAVPVAIVANILRLMILALLGIFISPEAAMGFLHEGSGLLVFTLGLLLLMLLAGMLKVVLAQPARASAPPSHASAAFTPNADAAHQPPALAPVRFSLHYGVAMALLGLAFAGNTWLRAPKAALATAVDLQQLAPHLSGWREEVLPLAPRAEAQLKTDQTLLSNYYDAHANRVEFFIGYYEDQQFGAQVHSPLHCLPGAGWTIVRNEKFQLPFAPGAAAASKLHISKKNEQQLVVYWFLSDGEVVKNEMELKMRLLRNTLLRRATSVYFYRVCVAYQADESQPALQVLENFLTALRPPVSEN